MTYCLGWLTKRGAYLVVDSATTSSQPLRTNYSSFGEQHKRENGENVAVSVLKIYSAGNSALTYSGDSRVGLSITEAYQKTLRAGDTAYAALKREIVRNTPFSKGHTVSLICAFYESSSPRLISFNHDDDLEYIDHREGEVV